MSWCTSCGSQSGHRADCQMVENGRRIAVVDARSADEWIDRQHCAADVVAHVVELELETHARAGTDLKSALEGMATNYRARESQAMRVVRAALADADRRKRSASRGET